MIVRIMGEGQYVVDDAAVAALNAHDATLEAALAARDEKAFRSALHVLLGAVREHGQRLPDEELAPSEVILPAAEATLDEVAALLASDGLIPG